MFMPSSVPVAHGGSPLVDVIIPTHNRPVLLSRALQSVLEQTLPNFSVTVVADGCADDTHAYLAAVNDPRLTVLRTSGVGPAAARNAGVGASSSPLVAFLDDDNTWAPNFLAVMVEHMKPNVVLAYSGQQCYLAEGSAHSLRIVGRQIRSVPFNPVSLVQANYIDISCAVLQRDVFARMGGFDAKLPRLEVWDLYGRIAVSHPFDIVHVDEVLGYYWYYLPASMPSGHYESRGDDAIRASFALKFDPSRVDIRQRILRAARQAVLR